MPTRREFLKRFSSATPGIFFVGCNCLSSSLGFSLNQQQASADTHISQKRRQVVIGGHRVLTIDVHSHVAVPEVWDLVKDRVMREGLTDEKHKASNLQNLAYLAANGIHNVDKRLMDMDKMGIDMQAVSINPFWYWADRDLARKIVQIQNEKMSALCMAYPDRFVGLGAIAIQHPDLAAEQMEEGVKDLGLRGFGIGGSVNGKELSDPMFHPFWAKAEQLQALIFIHPQGFSGSGDYPSAQEQPRLQGNGHLGNVVGQPLETALALTHLIQGGTLDLYPRLKICAAHGGGYLPSYSSRSDRCLTVFPTECLPLKKKPSEYLKELYYDSVLFTAEDMRHLIAVAGPSQVVVGTDYPSQSWNPNPVDRILEVPGLADEQQREILGGTLQKLLRIDARSKS